MAARITFNRYQRNNQKPERDGMSASYLANIRQCCCLICGGDWFGSTDPHHLMRSGEHAAGRRSSDRWAVPLCRIHHNALHADGNEDAWFAKHNIDGRAIAKALWSKRDDLEAMQRIAWRTAQLQRMPR